MGWPRWISFEQHGGPLKAAARRYGVNFVSLDRPTPLLRIGS